MIKGQRQREFAEASARGTLDIESPAIQQRYKQRLEEVEAKRDLQCRRVRTRRASRWKASGGDRSSSGGRPRSLPWTGRRRSWRE